MSRLGWVGERESLNILTPGSQYFCTKIHTSPCTTVHTSKSVPFSHPKPQPVTVLESTNVTVICPLHLQIPWCFLHHIQHLAWTTSVSIGKCRRGQEKSR